ncbi:MAG: 23S rRNA (pseudouridine(1915)-N(3))-methyltransferase RlmH [Mogibacterium sp.]|nr:23S rRNA (pseudouridine(1915)-N(3))-methyltransferase RlmH [Mogibacterium sp.]
MTINILCIGKLKERYWQDACAEYLKRIGGYSNIRVTELKEVRLPGNASAADERAVVDKEGERLLAKIADGDYVIAMEIGGKMLDSVELSEHLSGLFASGRSTVDFVIGGSLGLSDAVRRRADFALSMSRMTFPHQLARVLLLEQIYRAFKISAGESYHK